MIELSKLSHRFRLPGRMGVQLDRAYLLRTKRKIATLIKSWHAVGLDETISPASEIWRKRPSGQRSWFKRIYSNWHRTPNWMCFTFQSMILTNGSAAWKGNRKSKRPISIAWLIAAFCLRMRAVPISRYQMFTRTLRCQAAGSSEAIVRRHYLKMVAENEDKQLWGIKPESWNCSFSGLFLRDKKMTWMSLAGHYIKI